MIIQTQNNLTIAAPKTYLANAVTAGTSIMAVRNLSGFASSWAVQVGETGEQQSEVLLLGTATPSGTIGTFTANCLYNHPADTPVYAIKWDQIVFERSITGTAGTATPMAGGTVTIQANSATTLFDDTSGSASYAYRTYFQNSILATSTTESDWITPSGFSFNSLGKMRQRVKDKLVNSGYIDGIKITDDEVNDWLNEWLEVMTNTIIDVNEDYQLGTTSLAYAAGVELGTLGVTDFKQLRRVWVSTATGTFQATKMDSNSFSPNKTFSDSYPYFYMQGDNVIGRQPTLLSATLYLEYYKLNPVLVEDTDTIPVNMQGYTKSFVDYAHAQALFKDQKIPEAQMKLGEAQQMLAAFKSQSTPRNKTGVTYIDIVEDTAADQELWL